MNKNKICEILDWAIKQGTKPFPLHPNINPKSNYAKNLRYSMVSVSNQIIEKVIQELKKEKELKIYDNHIMATGGGGHRLDLRSLAEWLLAQSLRVNIEWAVNLLEKTIKSTDLHSNEILAIYGLIIEKKIELIDNVFLLPFSQTPESVITDKLNGIQEFMPNSNYWSPPNEFGFNQFMKPSAALIVKSDLQFLKEFPKNQKGIKNNFSKLNEICKCLTLIGPSSPTPVAHWFHVDDLIPLATKSSSSSHMIHDKIPNNSYKITKNDILILKNVIPQFLSLNIGIKEKLSVSIDRLNNAFAGQNPVNKIIDLAISLESILCMDRDKDAPISYIFRLRGSKFLEKKYTNRKEIYDLLKNIYDLRSKAVHTGSIGKKTSIPKVNEIIEKGLNLSKHLIIEIILMKKFPDWDTLVLET